MGYFNMPSNSGVIISGFRSAGLPRMGGSGGYTPESDEEKKKREDEEKRSERFLFIVAILFGLAIIAGVIFLYYSMNLIGKHEVPLNNNPVQERIRN